MKKGRILIQNLEVSRLKFLNGGGGQLESEKKEKKGPFFPVDASKMRMAGRISSFNIAYQLGMNFKDNIRKYGQNYR